MPKIFWQVLFYYLIAVNVLAFVLMGLDKRRAKKNAWRIPERTLFLPVIFGGALGGVAGGGGGGGPFPPKSPATGIFNMASPCCCSSSWPGRAGASGGSGDKNFLLSV